MRDRPDQRVPGSPRGADWLPLALVGLFLLVTAPTNFFLPVFFRERLGFSGAQIGLLFATQAITGVVAAWPVGLGNDRLRSRQLVALGLALSAAGYALLGALRSFVPVLLLFFGLQLAINVFRQSLDLQMLKTDTGERTGERFGRYQAARFGGLTLGTAAAGYLLARLDFTASLLLVAGLCLGLVLLARRLPDTAVAPVPLAAYWAAFTERRVLLFAGWLFLFALHWGAELTCYGLFLREGLGLSLAGMGWYLSVEFLAILVTVLVGGRAANHPAGLRRFTILGLLLSGVGHVGMVLPQVAASVAFRALHGVGDGLILLVLYVGLRRLFATRSLGGNTGMVNLVLMVGTIAGALVAGPAGERFGYGHPLWVSGVFLVLLILPLLSARVKDRLTF